VLIGWLLGIYNAGGLVAALLLPGYAGRKHDYLGPILRPVSQMG